MIDNVKSLSIPCKWRRSWGRRCSPLAAGGRERCLDRPRRTGSSSPLRWAATRSSSPLPWAGRPAAPMTGRWAPSRSPAKRRYRFLGNYPQRNKWGFKIWSHDRLASNDEWNRLRHVLDDACAMANFLGGSMLCNVSYTWNANYLTYKYSWEESSLAFVRRVQHRSYT